MVLFYLVSIYYKTSTSLVKICLQYNAINVILLSIEIIKHKLLK